MVGGIPKIAKAIKSWWNWVSPPVLTIYTTDQCMLKWEYDIIKELRSLSGFGWDPQNCIVTLLTMMCGHIHQGSKYTFAGQLFLPHVISELEWQQGENGENLLHKPSPPSTIGDLVDGTQATGRVCLPGRPHICFWLQQLPTCDNLLPLNKKPAATFYRSDELSSSESDPISPSPSPPPAKHKCSHTAYLNCCGTFISQLRRDRQLRPYLGPLHLHKIEAGAMLDDKTMDMDMDMADWEIMWVYMWLCKHHTHVQTWWCTNWPCYEENQPKGLLITSMDL